MARRRRIGGGEIIRRAVLAGVSVSSYAHAVSHPVVINVQSVERFSDRTVRVVTSTLGGTIDVIIIDASVVNTTAALRGPLAAAHGVSAAAISIVLPSGQVCTIGPEHEGRL